MRKFYLSNPSEKRYIITEVIMGKVRVQPVYSKNVGFEQVWAALDRITERHEKISRQIEENNRLIEKSNQQIEKNSRQMDEYNKRFGEFSNRFGEVVEYMIAPKLREKFWDMGLKFNMANPNAVFSDGNKIVLFEVDVLLQNGDKAMLVEVKTKLTAEDVKDHIKRLEKMRAYADCRGDKRLFLGAVAGVVMTANVKEYAFKQGFFVIEPSGETFNITPPSELKEW